MKGDFDMDPAAGAPTGRTAGSRTERAEKFWRDLFAAVDAMKIIHADSRKVSVFCQVTLSQLKMVNTVFELTRSSGEGVPLKDVARDLGTTAAAASEMVDVLVRKKILERNQDPGDRRQIRIRLVPELRDHFRSIEANFTNLAAAYLATLPEEKREALISGTAGFLEFVGKQGREKAPENR